MNNYTFTSNNGVRYTRISKPAARKIYDNGGAVYVCPVKCSPVNEFWQTGTIIDNPAADPDRAFDKVINAFEFYNCGYNELGRYAAFYVIG